MAKLLILVPTLTEQLAATAAAVTAPAALALSQRIGIVSGALEQLTAAPAVRDAAQRAPTAAPDAEDRGPPIYADRHPQSQPRITVSEASLDKAMLSCAGSANAARLLLHALKGQQTAPQLSLACAALHGAADPAATLAVRFDLIVGDATPLSIIAATVLLARGQASDLVQAPSSSSALMRATKGDLVGKMMYLLSGSAALSPAALAVAVLWALAATAAAPADGQLAVLAGLGGSAELSGAEPPRQRQILKTVAGFWLVAWRSAPPSGPSLLEPLVDHALASLLSVEPLLELVNPSTLLDSDPAGPNAPGRSCCSSGATSLAQPG